MDSDALPPYVETAGPNQWIIRAATTTIGSALLKMNFGVMADGVSYELRPPAPMAFEEVAIIAGQLREMGVAFSAGSGWSPSEVVKYLRDRELCQGPFTEIYWTSPGKWHLRPL